MTEPQKPNPTPTADPEAGPEGAGPAAAVAEPEPPPPEPWTAERVSEWNAYYDVYVMLGTLLLVFVASAGKIEHSSIWPQLQVGRTILATGSPVTRDAFSYTEDGKPWVNVPWLFEASHAALHKAASDAMPVDPADLTGTKARAEQVGAAALVALDALARLLTALLLLNVRRSGPGRWWSAVCVALAFGVVLRPLPGQVGVQLGGIAGPGAVAPETWGVLFLAAMLWILSRAVHGRPRAVEAADADEVAPGPAVRNGGRFLFALVPLFLVWANVDESFLVGLLLLGAWAVGRVRPAVDEAPGAPGLPVALGAFGASALACLVNPSFHKVYLAGLDPFLALFRPAGDVLRIDELSFFGAELRKPEWAGFDWKLQAGFYLVLVALGAVSFVLNRRRFSLARFLVFAAAAALWAALIRYGAEFAAVLAAAAALNGQEWYQDRFGTRGRLGMGWSFWSVGGRALTIVLLFAAVALVLLGYGGNRFGFGFDADDFAFEAADALKAAPIKGNVLNTTMNMGDAIVWRAGPDRKTYIDNRKHLFPIGVLNRLQEARKALKTDDVAGWKPLLDEHKVSAVMIQPEGAPSTYQMLSKSPNWVPFYDDGSVVMFGRSDAPADDLAYFQANRLDSEAMAYKRSNPSPPPGGPPTPVNWMDEYFQTRSTAHPQPHTASARRWLSGVDPGEDAAALPDPARCLLAVREARTALATKPDDTQAYRLLAVAYRALMTQESALLSGIKLTRETAAQVAQLTPSPGLLPIRFRQRVTALNYAIQTTPPARTAAARRELHALNLELFQLFLSVNFFDLARDRLQAVVDRAGTGDFSPESKVQLSQQLAKLNEQVKQVQTQMNDLAVERQLSPIQLADYALRQGTPGLALHELEEAERTGTNPTLVKPQLLDLYCETGQPDKAMEMLSTGTAEDPSFGDGPGVAATRQARAYFLLGNDDYAGTLWEKNAIPRLRYERTTRALSTGQTLTRGEVKAAVGSFLELPEKINLQASWEYEAGICRLEGGTPDLAAEHFAKALELAPKAGSRPVAAYYLERLGKPVPAAPEPAATPAPSLDPLKAPLGLPDPNRPVEVAPPSAPR